MAYLTLNGITIPVASGDGGERDDSMYAGARSITGTYVEDLVATKRIWECTTPILSRAEALAVKGLVLGDGQSWSFDTDLYSDKKGALLTSSGNATRATSAPTPKFGAGRLNVATSAITYWDESLANWTVGVWYYDTSVWVHRLETAAGTQWEDGVEGVYGWSLAPSGTAYQLGVGAWDDLVLLPYTLTDAQGLQWPQSEAWSNLPHMTLDGDISNGQAYTVQADRGSVSIEHVTAVIGGGTTTGWIVSFVLKQV